MTVVTAVVMLGVVVPGVVVPGVVVMIMVMVMVMVMPTIVRVVMTTRRLVIVRVFGRRALYGGAFDVFDVGHVQGLAYVDGDDTIASGIGERSR
jgi:hypothetical protein